MSKDMNMSLVGFGAATQARIETNHAQQEASEEKQRALAAQSALRNITTDKDLERKVRGLGIEKDILTNSVENLRKQLAERDALLIEWMHSTEAFRRLARQYGKKIDISDDQRRDDYLSHALDISEEDIKFSETDVAKKSRLKKS